MSYPTIEELKSQVALPDLERALARLKERIEKPIREKIEEENIEARIVDVGSTNRGTYVLDPNAPYRPFPPQVDLCLIVQGGEDRLKALNKEILKKIPRRSVHQHEDVKHGRLKIIAVDRNFVVIYALLTQEAAKKHPEYSYNDSFQFDREQQIDARVLKLLLERYGCAARYNRGFDELTVDEIVRQKGGIEECVEFLEGAAQTRDNRILRWSDIDLLQNVPDYMWERIARLVTDYAEGRLKSTPFTHEDWIASHRDGIDLSSSIQCSPATCGREGYQIAEAVRKIMDFISSEFRIKHGFDYYIVPCLGPQGGMPFTRVFASVKLTGQDNRREYIYHYFNNLLQEFSSESK